MSSGGNVSPPAQGGLAIFDDTTPRPTKAPGGSNLFDTVQWGVDTSTLLAANSSTTGFDLYTLAVNAAGVTVSHDFPGAFTTFGQRIHFEPSKNLVYSDDGQIIDPATGALNRTLPDTSIFRTSSDGDRRGC